jgi:hypothetical protein
MKLYVCWGTFQTFGPGHPCRNALDGLQANDHDPEVVRSYGWGLLPRALNRSVGRRLAIEHTGKSWLPLLVTDAGEIVTGSQAIKLWAIEHPRTSLGRESGVADAQPMEGRP